MFNDSGEHINQGLAQLGGGAAGYGIGALAKLKLDARYQNQLLEKALEENRAKEHSRMRWENMLKIQKGEASLEDYPLAQQDTYAKLLEENREQLEELARKPRMAERWIKEIEHGKVVPLFDNMKAPVRMDFPDKVHSPIGKSLPGGLGLAGLLGGGILYRHFHGKQNEEQT